MSKYQRARKKIAEMKRREYMKSKEVLEKFLKDKDAPKEVMNAFGMVAREPTYTWA